MITIDFCDILYFKVNLSNILDTPVFENDSMLIV